MTELSKANRELADRIRRAIAASGMTKRAIAAKVGLSEQSVTGWEKTGKISKETLGKLAAITRRPLGYFYGESEPESEDWDDILGYAQAVGLGNGEEANEYAETHKLKFRAASLARKRLRADKLAVMYGKGDSMLPRIRSGDAILFDLSDTRADHGGLFVIQTPGANGNEYNVKRCLELDGIIFFEALNPDADHGWTRPRRMDDRRNPISIIGRVKWVGSWVE